MSLTPFGYGRSRDVDPFGLGFGIGDMLGDYEREMRQMNRQLARMERGQGPTYGSMVDRAPILPHFVEQNGQKMAQFNFDVHGFKPEDISIKTTDGRVVVSAKHEDKGEDHHMLREFRRMVTVPPGTNIENMKSRLAPNGLLTIEAPYSPPSIKEESHKEIPIHHEPAKAIKH